MSSDLILQWIRVRGGRDGMVQTNRVVAVEAATGAVVQAFGVAFRDHATGEYAARLALLRGAAVRQSEVPAEVRLHATVALPRANAAMLVVFAALLSRIVMDRIDCQQMASALFGAVLANSDRFSFGPDAHLRQHVSLAKDLDPHAFFATRYRRVFAPSGQYSLQLAVFHEAATERRIVAYVKHVGFAPATVVVSDQPDAYYLGWFAAFENSAPKPPISLYTFVTDHNVLEVLPDPKL